jgi:fumarylacetoacetase
MALGAVTWGRLRDRLTAMLGEGAPERQQIAPHLVSLAEVTLHMPFRVSEYTDFYASIDHARNVGTMLRGAENALSANWLSMPVGYNGRASSVVVSGTPVRRPWGQILERGSDLPIFAPSRRFDMEVELGAVVGTASDGPVSVAQADAMIFGYVLLNDWSARDIQTWEYQPLGPFQSKATATTISPWVVMSAALAPFRVPTPHRERPLLPYLAEPGPMLFDIAIEATLAPDRGPENLICRTNARDLYYSAAQQLTHHAVCGCPMNVGDLLGSGTISGGARESRGSLLELTWGGAEPLTLSSGEERRFLEDGDRVTLSAHAQGPGYRIGFGRCMGTVVPPLGMDVWAGHLS